jgi:outer membrane lipoprotein-sorting protein
MRTLICIIVVLLTAAFARADLSATSTVDETLDSLYEVGKDLKSFTADVKLIDVQTAFDDQTTRLGKTWYERKPDGDSRMRVSFDKVIRDELTSPQKLDFLMDKGWLTERNYDKKNETRLQVLRPGEKVNLMKLGEGPFPLPIGQKRDDVLKQFEVEKIEQATNELPNAVHLLLTPKPGSQFERKFSTIHVWVDYKSFMPRKIETDDRNHTERRGTELGDMKLNAPVKEEDFRLPQIDAQQWTRQDKPFSEQ